MAVDIIPSGQACGAEIANIDISKPVPDRDAETIYRAFLEHQVVFFRNQEILPLIKGECAVFSEKWALIIVLRIVNIPNMPAMKSC